MSKADRVPGYNGDAFRRAVIAEHNGIDWLAHHAVASTERQEQMIRDALKREGHLRLQGCHVVPFQFIVNRGGHLSAERLLAAVMDPRNGVTGSQDLHDSWDRGMLHIPVMSLPESVRDFEREFGIDYLHTYYVRRA